MSTLPSDVPSEGRDNAASRTKAMLFAPTMTAGGAERVMSVLANVWCARPTTTVTLLLLFKDEMFYPIDPRVRVVCLGLRPILGHSREPRSILWAMGACRSAVLKEQPDFVLSFMHKYNVFCLFALLGSGIPTIVSERDSPNQPKRLFIWTLRRFIYHSAAGIIAQSKTGERYLRDCLWRANLTIILNPIPAIPAALDVERQKIVLCVARLAPNKGHADLLQAFAEAAQPGWTLALCGDGALRDELEALARARGIADRVRFEGAVKDVNAWYQRASVFAFPSYYEGFPNALAEAMAAGVSPVSYDCPTGPSELIRDGENGFLVPVGDIAGMAQRLRDLMTDPALAMRLSENARTIAQRLDAEVIASEYLDFSLQSAGAQRH